MQVIDASFNFDMSKPENVKRYLHVSIFTKTFEEAPKVGSIGDILYLKRFNVLFFTSSTGTTWADR